MKKYEIFIMLIGLIAGLLVLGYFVPKSLVKQFEKIIKEVKQKYGAEIAANVEKIYRLETANFTSGQFLKTYSPGMMAFTSKFPFGWVTLNANFWYYYPQFKPIGFESMKENPGLLGDGKGYKNFLVFPNLKAAVFTLAGFLKHYDNVPGRWFSTDPEKINLYSNKINSINSIFV